MKTIITLFIFTVAISINAQWNPQGLATGNYGGWVHMVDNMRGYLLLSTATQNKKILKTVNGGLNWTATSYTQPSSLTGIFFTSANTGYIVGSPGKVFKSTDGGNNFSPLTTGTTENLAGISFANENTGYAAGSNGAVIKTTNAGASWSSVNISTTGFIRFGLIDANNIIAASDLNVYKTTNGGANWQAGTLTGRNSVCVHMVNNLTGYIAGSSGTTITGSVNKTTDGGNTWQLILDNFTGLNGVCFTSENTGYIYGGRNSSDPFFATSYIGKTTNGGMNWYSQESGSRWPVFDMSFASSEVGVAAAFDVITYTVNGGGAIGIQQISTTVPNDFSLSQNYPNPFNPVTNIEFSVPKSAFIKLTVYDISGREVETLVSQNMIAGTYKADWDASKYSSGVYFYTITSGSYHHTKKMILIK